MGFIRETETLTKITPHHEGEWIPEPRVGKLQVWEKRPEYLAHRARVSKQTLNVFR